VPADIGRLIPREGDMTTNAELLERRNKAVARGVASATPVYAARAENAELWDANGKRYIDFAGGIAVLNTGHRHPKVMAAAREQLERYTHTAFQVVAYEPYIALAERLNKLAPFKGPAKTVLFTTGAEATENAIKIARAATKRTGVITFTGAFHGRTLLTMAMTGKTLPYKKNFGPMPAEIFHVPFPIEHHGVTVEDSLKALQFLFKADIEPTRVAAIMIEPVQGEGGFYVAPKDLLTELRRLCDEHGILLISDEVQSGFARTGKMFGMSIRASSRISSPSPSRWPAACRSPAWSARPRSWMRLSRAGSAAPMAATPWPAPPRWPCSTSSSRRSSWSAPMPWAAASRPSSRRWPGATTCSQWPPSAAPAP